MSFGPPASMGGIYSGGKKATKDSDEPKPGAWDYKWPLSTVAKDAC